MSHDKNPFQLQVPPNRVVGDNFNNNRCHYHLINFIQTPTNCYNGNPHNTYEEIAPRLSCLKKILTKKTRRTIPVSD